MITKDEFEKALIIVQEYQKQISAEYKRTEIYEKQIVDINTTVRDLDIGVRLMNILIDNDILTVGDLLNLDRKKAIRFSGCGQRTWTMIEELKDELNKMNIIEISKNNPELTPNIHIIVTASDLKEFANYCIEAGRQEKPEAKDPEEYLTPQQFAEILQVSLVTLWSWDKKGITRPLKIGNQKRYRRSDLEKILCNA